MHRSFSSLCLYLPINWSPIELRKTHGQTQTQCGRRQSKSMGIGEVSVIGDHWCESLAHKRMKICSCSSPCISNSFDQNNLVYIWIHFCATNFSFLIIMLPYHIPFGLHLQFLILYHWQVSFLKASSWKKKKASSWILYFKRGIKTIHV